MEEILVGIMVEYPKMKRKTLRTYSKFKDLGLEIFTFTPRNIDWRRKRIRGTFDKEGRIRRKYFPFPKVVYNRCYSIRYNKIIFYLEQIIGKNRCFNHCNHFNKWETHKILNNSEMRELLPSTTPFTEYNLDVAIREKKAIYLKPSYGCLGKNILRLEPLPTGEIKIFKQDFSLFTKVQDSRDLKKKLTLFMKGKKFILQEEISLKKFEKQHFDIRVLLQKDINGQWAVANLVSRVAIKNFFITNFCKNIYITEDILKSIYPGDKARTIIEKISNVAKKGALFWESYIGQLGELSIDFGIDESDKIWIIEINGKPQKKIYDELTNLEDKEQIYKRPLEYACYLAKKKEAAWKESD